MALPSQYGVENAIENQHAKDRVHGEFITIGWLAVNGIWVDALSTCFKLGNDGRAHPNTCRSQQACSTLRCDAQSGVNILKYSTGFNID